MSPLNRTSILTKFALLSAAAFVLTLADCGGDSDSTRTFTDVQLPLVSC